MSKPTGSEIRKSSSSGDQTCPDDRLIKTFRVSKKMRPFVGRMRMRVEDFDLTDPAMASQFASSREQMRAILAKKKIPDAKANLAIAQTLELAANHRLQPLRQNESQQDRVRSARDVGRLITRLQGLAAAIAKLPPASKGKLNAIVAEHTAEFFDTEKFADLIRVIADTLPKLAPKRLAQHALDAINQPVAGVIRTSSSELIELWETMSAETRRRVEEEVRRSRAKTSAMKFFRQLVVLLNKHLPRAKRGRLQTIQRQYVQRAGKVWASLGLKIGRAYDGERNKNIESSFQRFARLALASVGDASVISRRQIAKPKKGKAHQQGNSRTKLLR